METIDFKGKFTAVKIHFGEPGNLAYIRPNYAATVVSYIRKLGGIPFLTDANTLYTGRRSNAVDHLRAAEENGFTWTSTGANIIIADGLRGTEFREIEINQKHCRTAKISSAIADADIVISMSHFKGHELTGFGGALKNIGMGSGSRGGKLEMHSTSQPAIKKAELRFLRSLYQTLLRGKRSVSTEKRRRSLIMRNAQAAASALLCACPMRRRLSGMKIQTTSEKIAEYALAVLKGKPNFHISFIMNVSPELRLLACQ